MVLPEYQGKRNIPPSLPQLKDIMMSSGAENVSPRYEAMNAGQSQMNQMQSGFNDELRESSELPPLIVDNGNVIY